MWGSRQRKVKESLSIDRLKRLNDLGFVWDLSNEKWEEGFAHLVNFQELNGHCNVPRKHYVNGYNLGIWVGRQRNNKESISVARLQRLNDLGFVWDVADSVWEEGFNFLIAFKQQEGHCNVPKGYVVDGFNLGSWVNNQRVRKEKIQLLSLEFYV